MAVVRWNDWEGHGLEHCVRIDTGDGLTLEGVVAGTRHGTYGGHYFVRADSAFRTREVRLEYVGGPLLHVESDGIGKWYDVIGNRELPNLADCIDVDIGITPATNTLPIKRLSLGVGESRDIAAAYVPLPDQIDGDFLPQARNSDTLAWFPIRNIATRGFLEISRPSLKLMSMVLS